MTFNLRVIPKASRNLVKAEGDSLKVYLTKPACEGLANEQLLKLLAEHFKVKKYCLKIIQGQKSRNKVVELIENA
ncbi:MAG: DUF167 domain-containing protein [Candidatus Omnitrophica bacterium]|jgi:hypothetical protein|nr:DUF167 domain-containing protein [Candidatus Omnitrophota bacterium]